MSLIDKLAKRAHEGSAGAAAYRGFTYQHHLSLCKLIEVQESGDDYQILIEHHDDLVIWRSPPDGKLECFQIKTHKSGNWTTARLIKREDGPSPVGKLYHHTIDFDEGVETLHFISNARYSLGVLRDGSDSKGRVRIACTELNDGELERLRQAIKEEYALSTEPDFEGLLIFSQADLPLSDFTNHTIAKVTQLLDRHAAGSAIRPIAAYHTLMGEIEQRAAFDANTLAPVEAYHKKSITRRVVTQMLNEMVRTASTDPWPTIAATLTSVGWSPVRIHRLGKVSRTLAARKTLAEGASIIRAMEAARTELRSMPELALDDTLAQLRAVLLQEVDMTIIDDDELTVAALEVLYGV